MQIFNQILVFNQLMTLALHSVRLKNFSRRSTKSTIRTLSIYELRNKVKETKEGRS